MFRCIQLPCEAWHSDGSAIVPGMILSLDSTGHVQYVLQPEQMPELEMVRVAGRVQAGDSATCAQPGNPSVLPPPVRL